MAGKGRAGLIAVIGGGPAGAMAAAELAQAGYPVRLFDEKLAWEKPCGGGVTAKALHQYPFLGDAVYARNWVNECALTSPRGRTLLLPLDRPIAIFSRRVLNQLLLDRACRAGAEIVHDRVVACVPSATAAGHWDLRLRSGAELRAAVAINTSGARNPLAHLPSPLTADDWMATAGYYIPAARLPWPAARMLIRFLPGLDGYIWSFPRADHASVGICGRLRQQSTAQLRQRLEQQLEAWGLDRTGAAFYAHLLPAPSPSSLARAGGGVIQSAAWMAAGDATGLVDPITGEGLYYALRSAELLAAAWHGSPTPPQAVAAYTQALQRELVPELAAAGRVGPRFFQGRFAGDAVLERMIQFGQRSTRFRLLLCDLFSGAQGYTGLRRRLWRNLIPSLAEMAASGGSLEMPRAERASPRPPAQIQRGGPAANRSPPSSERCSPCEHRGSDPAKSGEPHEHFPIPTIAATRRRDPSRWSGFARALLPRRGWRAALDRARRRRLGRGR